MKIKEDVKNNASVENTKVADKKQKEKVAPKTETKTKTAVSKKDGDIEVVVDKGFMDAYPAYDEIFVSKRGGAFATKFNGAIKKIVRTK